MAVTGLIVLGGLTVGTTIDSRERAKSAEKKQEKLSEIQRAQAADSATRERRNQIRQQRVAMSKAQNLAVQTGQQDSTAITYGMSNVQSQVSNNLGAVNTALAFGGVTSKLQQDIFNLQQPSDLQYASQIANSIFEAPKIKIKAGE